MINGSGIAFVVVVLTVGALELFGSGAPSGAWLGLVLWALFGDFESRNDK